MASIASVGLAHHANGTHCGVYYESAAGAIELLHLTGHNSLKSEPVSAYYFNVETMFAERQKIAVSDLCRLFFGRYGSAALRYSAARTDSILSSGELAIDRPGVGFSCATIIIQIFETGTAPLIDKKSYPLASRADRDWLAWLIGIYRRIFIASEDEEHFDNVDASCKWSRFRPEEVAAAASVAPPPARFKSIQKLSQQLVAHVKAAVAPLP